MDHDTIPYRISTEVSSAHSNGTTVSGITLGLLPASIPCTIVSITLSHYSLVFSFCSVSSASRSLSFSQRRSISILASFPTKQSSNCHPITKESSFIPKFTMTGKVALITGITGQDGSYLTEFLLSKGYTVRPVNSE